MNDNWEVRIVNIPGMYPDAIYFMRGVGYGVQEYLKPDNSVIIVKREDAPTQKDLVFAYLDRDQLRSLAVAINERGIKLPEASFTQGKLEATEKHLEDMRAIVGHVKNIKFKETK